MMENNNKHLDQNFLTKALCLLSLAFLGLLAEYYFKDILLFSLSWKQHSGLKDSLALLPILLLFHIGLQKFITNKKNLQIVVPCYYLFIFHFLSPEPLLAFMYILFFVLLFFMEKHSRKIPFISVIVFIIMMLLILIPMFLYSFNVPLSPLQIYFLVLFKSCLLMRVISWFIDRRVYKRVTYDTLAEFTEFIFCPIFFIFPGQIQFFLFDYFHKNKVNDSEKINFTTILWLGLWGYFLMIVYSKLDYFFWHNYYRIPFWIGRSGFFGVEFAIGLYWLVLIYFQQTAGMAYQVSLARIMGYNFKYDMHWPLLARSPLDYLRRHSSYVRDYIVEMGLKPLALVSLRKGISSYLVLPIASVISYAFFISIQSGYRPDYNRKWSVTLIMILFLMIFISLPYMHSFFKKTLYGQTAKLDSLLAEAHHKTVKEWVFKDYLMWLGTLICLGCYKMFLGLAK